MVPATLIDSPSGMLGLGALIAFVLCGLLGRRLRHGLELSVLLMGLWLYSKVIAYLWGWETARHVAPMGDVLALCLTSFAWYLDPRQWKLGIMYAYLTKLFIHAIFWRNGVATTHDARELHNYALALNILYALAILCVLSAGVWTIGTLVGSRVAPDRAGGRGIHAAGRRQASRQAAKGVGNGA
jgi:hypothetical protein